MNRGLYLLLLGAMVALAAATSKDRFSDPNSFEVLAGYDDDDDDLGDSPVGDDKRDGVSSDVDDVDDGSPRPQVDYSSGGESDSETYLRGVSPHDAAIDRLATKAAKDVVEQETPSDVDSEIAESQQGSPERKDGVDGDVVADPAAGPAADSADSNSTEDDSEEATKVLVAPGGLAGSFGTSRLSSEEKIALSDQCSAGWANVCLNIITKPKKYNDDVLNSWIITRETSTEAMCYHLVESQAKRSSFNKKEKPACYLNCLKKAEVFRGAFDHMCQFENDEWRLPSTSEMFLACRQDDLASIVGARDDEPFEGPAHVGWDVVKDKTSQLTFAFEKESKSLSFLNFYKPTWFPPELWGKDDMCLSNTKRCVMPFCLVSGDPKIKPCVEPEWGYTHVPHEKDEEPWLFCKRVNDSDKTTECQKVWEKSDRTRNGLIRTHACTHYQKPANAIKCVLHLNSALSWGWTEEDVETVKTNMYKFYLRKAAKKCVMENLRTNVPCHARKKGGSKWNILQMYRYFGSILTEHGVAEAQEGISHEGCNPNFAYMDEDTFSCLNNEIGDYLGEAFFEFMPKEGKNEALSFANVIFEESISDRRGRDGKAKDQDKIPQFKWLKYATKDVIDAIADSYKYDDLEKEKERVEHFTHQSYSDYELFYGAKNDGEDRFYKYNRGRPMLGFLPDRLIHENSHSWELTHRKCTPTLGMLAGMVGVVQRGIIDSNNLHVHMVFPRAPSDCCACKKAKEVDPGIQCGYCTQYQCASNQLTKLEERGGHEDDVAKLTEASRREVAMYRVNRLLAALACQINDYEAVGKWYRSFSTRYLTVWSSEDATKLKSTVAAGGQELKDIESKTGGHSWGTYKNAFTGFRAGIYGSDDLVGFEFRSLSARLPEKIKKDLTLLKPKKAKDEFYPMVRVLQRVVKILSQMSIEAEGDAGIKADGVIVKLNPFGIGLSDEEGLNNQKEAVSTGDLDTDDVDLDIDDDINGSTSSDSASGGSPVDMKDVDASGLSREEKRLSKPIPLKVLDEWQEESRTVGMKYFGFPEGSALSDTYCPAAVVLVYDLSDQYSKKLKKEKNRSDATGAVMNTLARNGATKQYADVIRGISFEMIEDGRWQMQMTLSVGDAKTVSAIQNFTFREFCGQRKRSKKNQSQSLCSTTSLGVLPSGKPSAHVSDLNGSINPTGCVYDASTERNYPLPLLNFINKIISDDQSVSKACAQAKWSGRVAKALVGKPEMSFDFWSMVDDLRKEEGPSNIPEEERIPSVNVVKEYYGCLTDTLNRVSFLTTNTKDFEALAVAVSDENRVYKPDGLTHVMEHLFLNPYVMKCTPEHKAEINLDEPDAGHCEGSESIICKQRTTAKRMGKNRLWKKLAENSSSGQCLNELRSYQFALNAKKLLDPHFEM